MELTMKTLPQKTIKVLFNHHSNHTNEYECESQEANYAFIKKATWKSWVVGRMSAAHDWWYKSGCVIVNDSLYTAGY